MCLFYSVLFPFSLLSNRQWMWGMAQLKQFQNSQQFSHDYRSRASLRSKWNPSPFTKISKGDGVYRIKKETTVDPRLPDLVCVVHRRWTVDPHFQIRRSISRWEIPGYDDVSRRKCDSQGEDRGFWKQRVRHGGRNGGSFQRRVSGGKYQCEKNHSTSLCSEWYYLISLLARFAFF